MLPIMRSNHDGSTSEFIQTSFTIPLTFLFLIKDQLSLRKNKRIQSIQNTSSRKEVQAKERGSTIQDSPYQIATKGLRNQNPEENVESNEGPNIKRIPLHPSNSLLLCSPQRSPQNSTPQNPHPLSNVVETPTGLKQV